MRVQDNVLLTTAATWCLECLGALTGLRQPIPDVASFDGLLGIIDAGLHLEPRS